MARCGAAYLVTRDIKGFKKAAVRVANPPESVALLVRQTTLSHPDNLIDFRRLRSGIPPSHPASRPNEGSDFRFSRPSLPQRRISCPEEGLLRTLDAPVILGMAVRSVWLVWPSLPRNPGPG